MKLLLVLLVLWLGWRLVRAQIVKRLAAQRVPPQHAPQALSHQMVACAHCGVHVPQAEAVPHGDQWFCSPAHASAHRSAPQTSPTAAQQDA